MIEKVRLLFIKIIILIKLKHILICRLKLAKENLKSQKKLIKTN